MGPHLDAKPECGQDVTPGTVCWQELLHQERTDKERLAWEAQLQAQREKEEAEKLAKQQVCLPCGLSPSSRCFSRVVLGF